MRHYRFFQKKTEAGTAGVQISLEGKYISASETMNWIFTGEKKYPQCSIEEAAALHKAQIHEWLSEGYEELTFPRSPETQLIGEGVRFSDRGDIFCVAELREDRILTLPDDKSGPLCLWDLKGNLVFEMAHSHLFSYDLFASSEPGVVLLAPQLGYYSKSKSNRLFEVIRLTPDGNAFTLDNVIIEGLGNAARIYGRAADASFIYICTEKESRIFDTHSGKLVAVTPTRYNYESAAYLLGESQIALFQNSKPYCIGFLDIRTGEIVREMAFSYMGSGSTAQTYVITPDDQIAVVNGSVGNEKSDTVVNMKSLERITSVSVEYPDDPHASKFGYLLGISSDAKLVYFLSPSVGLVGVDTKTGEKLWRKTPHVTSNLLVSKAGKWLAYVGGRRLRLRDAHTGEPLLNEDGVGGISKICRYPELRRYVVQSDDIYVLDDRGTVLHCLKGEQLTTNESAEEFVFWVKGRIQCFNLVRNEMVTANPAFYVEYTRGCMRKNLHAVAYQEGVFLVFDRTRDWHIKIRHHSPTAEYAISPEEKFVYYAGRFQKESLNDGPEYNWLRTRDLENSQEWELKTEIQLQDLTVSPDGTRLIALGKSSIYLYHVEMYSEFLFSVAVVDPEIIGWSADGRKVLLTTSGSMFLLLDIESRQITEVAYVPENCTAFHFGTDGILACAGTKGIIHLLDLNPWLV